MFLEIINLQKLYDTNNGAKNINLQVNKGEFVTLLGPSGCGKTTTLNMIGGFLKADSGKILLDNIDITNYPAEERPISTVFQSYALFPHMNVIENVSYGIRFSRKKKKKEALEIAKQYLEIVGLLGHEKSRVGNLSGGQQQRVALARAMATNPKILLLDEPLSNLDANLRVKLREELKELQKKLNITMIFVTHDQEEALCLSDKIVIMDKGNIVQIGTPKQVYFNPVNTYISSLIGKSNIIKKGEKYILIRPEDINIKYGSTANYKIISKTFMGSHTEYIVKGDGNSLQVNLSGIKNSHFETDDRVELLINNEIEIDQ
ncbi:ABC transporter ATP-binding protein [Clostridium sp.]|uniref:ABC transporter ATP-binding protein n=1 Tax=Clostridium sp. TaxID=1506 RepID=UPI003D6D1557